MIYDAEMQWLEAKQGAKDSAFLTTTFDLANGEKEKSVQFPEAFAKGTQVDVVGWMQSFRIGTEEGKDYACDFWATRINNKGFTAHADCGDNTERLTVTWIALKKGKNSVATGSFNTGSDEEADENSQERRGNVEFGEGIFDKAPTVLVALSQFELAGGKDLRIGVEVEDVSEEGFSWVIRKCLLSLHECMLRDRLLTSTRYMGKRCRRRSSQRRGLIHCSWILMLPNVILTVVT